MTPHHPAITAVGDLIRSRTERVTGDDGAQWTIHVPCLLLMLIVHLRSSTTGAGGSTGGASTIPLNTQAWDLLVEIRHNAYSWAQLLDVDPARYATPDTPRAGKPVTPPVGKLLRACAVQAVTRAREPVADAIARCARRWVSQIEQIAAGQAQIRPVRGVACQDCGATSIVDVRDADADPPEAGRYPTPAVVLVSPPDDEPTLVCNACGSWVALRLHPALGTATIRSLDVTPGTAA